MLINIENCCARGGLNFEIFIDLIAIGGFVFAHVADVVCDAVRGFWPMECWASLALFLPCSIWLSLSYHICLSIDLLLVLHVKQVDPRALLAPLLIDEHNVISLVAATPAHLLLVVLLHSVSNYYFADRAFSVDLHLLLLLVGWLIIVLVGEAVGGARRLLLSILFIDQDVVRSLILTSQRGCQVNFYLAKLVAEFFV